MPLDRQAKKPHAAKSKAPRDGQEPHPLSGTATVCEHCDWVNVLPSMHTGQRLRCQRCHHILVSLHPKLVSQLYVNSLVGLLMYLLSVSFAFVGFSTKGLSQTMGLLDSVTILIAEQFSGLALLVAGFLFVLPLCFLLAALSLAIVLRRQFPPRRYHFWLLHLLRQIRPWLMIDVFLLGCLVALVKLHGMAKVTLGPSFFAFCALVVLLARLATLLDKRLLWAQLVAPMTDSEAKAGPAHAQQLRGCDACGSVVSVQATNCPRCLHSLTRRRSGLATPCALLIAACILYIPANLYPIMTTTFIGMAEPSTIIGGVVLLWGMHSYPVALVILIASVLVPIAKILALFWLIWQVRNRPGVTPGQRQHIYKLTEFIGRWSMVDVFVVAILSALVQLGALMNVIPGVAAVSFAGVVILTMLAAMSFDSRLIWDGAGETPH